MCNCGCDHSEDCNRLSGVEACAVASKEGRDLSNKQNSGNDRVEQIHSDCG